jgi:hypothetical protein
VTAVKLHSSTLSLPLHTELAPFIGLSSLRTFHSQTFYYVSIIVSTAVIRKAIVVTKTRLHVRQKLEVMQQKQGLENGRERGASLG